MKATILITLLLLIMLTGCTHKPFQPPRDEYEMWLTPDVSRIDVFKSLLECGMTDPLDGNVELNGQFDLNGYVAAKRCMESLGYVNVHSPICSESSTLPACQPGAKIPKPSVERRLNSKYCQSARDMISEEKYQQCLMNLASKYERVTEKDCAYWHRDLVEECQP